MLIFLLLASLAYIGGIAGNFCSPAGCFCDDRTLTVTCSNSQLAHIPILLNPRTRKLTLDNNRIIRIQRDELSTYRDLVELNLSYNEIFALNRRSFSDLRKLEVLRLRGNLIQSLRTDAFSGLRQLRELDLSENDLSELIDYQFGDLRHLERLNLSRNAITTINPGAFQGLTNLRELHIQLNQLTSVPKLALHSVTLLRQLDLSYNFITAVRNETFKVHKSLTYLRLSGNDITVVDDNAFLGTDTLQQLYLDDNALAQIPTLSFRQLTNVKYLTVSGNLFTEVGTSAFEGLLELRELVIMNCKDLQMVAVNAFSGLYMLNTLWLANNIRLASIDEFAFERTVSNSLKRLNLFGNNFSHLPKSLIPWDQLDFLDLRYNPWTCNCQLKWLTEVLLNLDSRAAFREKTVCRSPQALKGTSLYSLANGKLNCISQSMPPLHLVLIVIASLLVLIFSITLILVFIFRRHWLKCGCAWCKCSRVGTATAPSPSRAQGRKFQVKVKRSWNGRHPECQSFLSSSSDSSSLPKGTANAGASSQSRNSSFKVLAEYPVPITEL